MSRISPFLPRAFFSRDLLEALARWLNIGQVPFCLFMNEASHLDRTPLVNTNLFSFVQLFFCETQQIVPSGQDSAILLARVSNHNAAFGLSCSLLELAA